MFISIGILAHNEENHVGAVIDDLARQTIFKSMDTQINIHVVANGCKDNTASVSKSALETWIIPSSRVNRHVHNLSKPGKANAWNEFVHNFTDKNSDYVFLLDADIRLPDEDTLASTLEGLIANPSAWIAVDEPIKDVSLKEKKSLLEKFILSFSRTTHNVSTAVCGQFYCVRYTVVQRIWMPTGIIGEDGFLRAMILTDCFKTSENTARLICVPGARHVFETRRNLRDIFHHQIRLAIGSGVNVLLFAHLRQQLEKLESIESYIKLRNCNDPAWLNSLIAERMKRGQYFVMYSAFLLRRPKYFLSLPVSDKLLKFPVYLAGTVVDIIVYLLANRLMRRGAAEGFW